MFKLRYLLIGLILGLVLGWIWFGQEVHSEARVADGPSSPGPGPTPRKSKDPLTEIEGIGPTYERALNALGIYTYAQLAGQDAAALASKMSARVTAERINRERWIEQAKKLAG